MNSQNGCTVWLTGLSGAGKTTLAQVLGERLRERGVGYELLDGDELRDRLSPGLGFSKQERDAHVRRAGYLCELLSRNGVITVAALISPYRAVRDELRARIPDFIEVYVECPLKELVRRDVKGLYRRALAGEIGNFTGVSDPYEPPHDPDVTVHTAEETPDASADRILATLERSGILKEFAAAPL